MEKDKFVQEIEALLHDNGAIKGTSGTKMTKWLQAFVEFDFHVNISFLSSQKRFH